MDRVEALDVPGLPERYCVEAPLGRGGQAQTLAATDTVTGDAVVVKVFRLAGSDAWKRFELFERECAVLRSLKHPSIPDYVEHGGDEDAGAFFLVMQRAPGESLQAQIDAGRRYTDAELDSILQGLLEALAYLHSLNPPVIHRDLKPGNVVLGEDGRVWLVDFGSVRDVLVDSRQSTVVGTYGYMAPEQLRGQSSPASDLYGLGATLAAAATGADAAKLPSKGLEIKLDDVIKPGRLRDRLQWMLRADPEARPASVAALRAGPAQPVTMQATRSDSPDDAELVSLLAAGRKIEAIKLHRTRAGVTLRVAKEHIDGLGASHPGLAQRSSSLPEVSKGKPALGRRELKVVGGGTAMAAFAALLASGSFGFAVAIGIVAAVAAIPFARGLARGLDRG